MAYHTATQVNEVNSQIFHHITTRTNRPLLSSIRAQVPLRPARFHRN